MCQWKSLWKNKNMKEPAEDMEGRIIFQDGVQEMLFALPTGEANLENIVLEITVTGLGYSFYNETPYPDDETAKQEVNIITEKIKKKEYTLRYLGNQHVELELTN